MADQLYLSYRVRGYDETNMHRHFEKVLRAFPFSRLSKSGVLLRINAVSFHEPPLYEQAFASAAELDPLLAFMLEYQSADSAATVETHWDLWQYDEDWKLAPARVELISFGPLFEDAAEDHLRIDFGPDIQFLPDPAHPAAPTMVESNVRSLLRLVHDLDDALSVEQRRLWTESGENFAERLSATIREQKPGPRLV